MSRNPVPPGGAAVQLCFPFYGPENARERPGDAVILFRLPRQAKETFAALAGSRKTSVTGLLNEIIGSYITGGKPDGKKQTGRGNVDTRAYELAKVFLLAHPEGIRGIDLANFLSMALDEEVKHSRAIRLIDLAEQNGFLVTEDGEGKNIRYYAYERLNDY